MKNKETKLIGVSLFAFLVIISIISIFIKNEEFISMVNYLSIPMFVLSILIMINKYYELLHLKLENDCKSYQKLFIDYTELAIKHEELVKQLGKPNDDAEKINQDLIIIKEQSEFSSLQAKKVEKHKNIYFWLMTIPICAILLLLAFHNIFELPKLEITFLNTFSLLVLVMDWLLVDVFVKFQYNKFAKQMNKISESIRSKENDL